MRQRDESEEGDGKGGLGLSKSGRVWQRITQDEVLDPRRKLEVAQISINYPHLELVPLTRLSEMPFD